jgi:hypothetical protein
MPFTITMRCFTGYKYLLRLALITISHSLFPFRLAFTFLAPQLQSMEDKRGAKRARCPSAEGSPPLSSTPTVLAARSGSPPLLGSPPEVSLRHPRSPVFEQGVPPGRLESWIFLRLQMKRFMFLILHGMQSLPSDSSVTSTVMS